MKTKIIVFNTILLLFMFLISHANATVIASSSGSMDWSGVTFNGGVGDVTWSGIYGDSRGAEALTRQTGSPGIIMEIESTGMAHNSFGTSTIGIPNTAEGTATTSLTSISSSGQVTNYGTGLNHDASGSAHLGQGFTVSASGAYSFQASYSFLNTLTQMDDILTEQVDFLHHASISILWLDSAAGAWMDLYQTVASGQTSGLISLTDISLDSTLQYSLELHTKNSARAYSPQSQSPVPEPATMLLFGLGLLGLAGVNRRKI